MNTYTYTEIANNWNLWTTYADPSATTTREWFDSADEAEKIAILVSCFGPESTDEDEESDPRGIDPTTGHPWPDCPNCGCTPVDGEYRGGCPECR